MANPVEIIPLLVVALVMVSAGGADVETIEIAADGERTIERVEDVLIVSGGSATIDASDRVTGALYLIGGETTIDGTVDGTVVQLAGTLRVSDGATIREELRLVGGDRRVDADASIGRQTTLPGDVTGSRSPVDRAVFLALQIGIIGLGGWVLSRRHATLLKHVGAAITDHGLISATVGVLASATGLALIVFMALTLILLPVSLLGILLGIVVVGYAYAVFGYLIGRRLPIAGVDRATVAGVIVFLVALEGVGLIPVVGVVSQLLLVVSGIGAVLITFFGLREFEPVTLPE